MSNFSIKIKEQRAGLKVSLSDLAVKTKIPLRYLNWLENDEFNKLPAPVYIIGILRIYAGYIKLNPEDLINDYLEEIEKSKTINKPENKFKTSFNIGFLGIVGWIVILASILIYFIYQVGSLNFSPTILLNPNTDLITVSETLIFSGQVKPNNSKLTINNNDILVSESGNFNKELFLNPGSNIFVVSAISKYGQKVEIIRKVLRE